MRCCAGCEIPREGVAPVAAPDGQIFNLCPECAELVTGLRVDVREAVENAVRAGEVLHG